MKRFLISVLIAFVATPAYAADIVAKSTLVRGAIITRSDIVVEQYTNENRETVLASLLGKEVKRTIYAGQKVNPKFIGPPILVKRNSRVTMFYRYGPLEISAYGRALDEGGMGDTITVMNLESRTRVNGVVNAVGNVEVNL